MCDGLAKLWATFRISPESHSPPLPSSGLPPVTSCAMRLSQQHTSDRLRSIRPCRDRRSPTSIVRLPEETWRTWACRLREDQHRPTYSQAETLVGRVWRPTSFLDHKLQLLRVYRDEAASFRDHRLMRQSHTTSPFSPSLLFQLVLQKIPDH